MQEFEFFRPRSVDELVALLDRTGGKVLAGGTDILPRLRRRADGPDCLLDISRIAELRYIRPESDWVRIGAATTHADLAASTLVREAAPALGQAAAQVGSPQTRTRGTLAGNLANASPAADTAPPLLALAAQLGLRSLRGRREVALEAFFRGPGATCLEPGECIERISFRRPAGRWGAAFLKVGRRNAMAISVVNAAASLVLAPDARILSVRLALGSVGPRPARCPHAEDLLAGQVPGTDLFHRAAQALQADIAPIADVRATAEYRRHAAAVVAERVLVTAWRQALERLS